MHRNKEQVMFQVLFIIINTLCIVVLMSFPTTNCTLFFYKMLAVAGNVVAIAMNALVLWGR